MWPFRSPQESLENRFKSLDQVIEDLATCCSNNAEAVRELQSVVKNVRGDVDLQWEKVNRGLARLARRADAQQEQASEGNGEDRTADAISQAILEGRPVKWRGR